MTLLLAQRPYIGPSESQSAAEAARPARSPAARSAFGIRPPLPVIRFRELHDAIAWFRDAWQDVLSRVDRLHEGWSTVEPGDHNGGPAWTDRFARFVVQGAESYDPLRMAWARMRFSGGLQERTGAAFLFVLACRDFDLRSSGMAMFGHCVCPQVHLPRCTCADPERGRHRHGPCPTPAQPLFEEYVGWVALCAISRLRDLVEAPPEPREVEQPGWMRRMGYQARDRGVAGG